MMPAEFNDLCVKITQQGDFARQLGRELELIVPRYLGQQMIQEISTKPCGRSPPKTSIHAEQQFQAPENPPGDGSNS